MVHYFYQSEQKEDNLKWYIDCEWNNNLDFETNPRDLDICTITLNNVNDYWTGIGKFIPGLSFILINFLSHPPPPHTDIYTPFYLFSTLTIDNIYNLKNTLHG